jgi:hypothetical protein
VWAPVLTQSCLGMLEESRILFALNFFWVVLGVGTGAQGISVPSELQIYP